LPDIVHIPGVRRVPELEEQEVEAAVFGALARDPAGVGLGRLLAAHEVGDEAAARTRRLGGNAAAMVGDRRDAAAARHGQPCATGEGVTSAEDRKSTRLNSSHVKISYAV